MIARVLEKIEETEAPFFLWCAGFLGILAVRFLLETLSGPSQSFPAVPDTATLTHYVLFFSGIFLSIALTLNLFVAGGIARVSKFLLFGFPVIWISPIADLISSRGGGYLMTYVFAGNANDLLRAFTHLGSVNIWNGLTPGLGTEMIVIIVGALLYVALKTKSAVKAVVGAALTYCVFYFWMVLPGLIAIVANGNGMPSIAVTSYLVSLFGNSRILPNLIRGSIGLSYNYAWEMAFNGGMAILLYIVDFGLIIAWNALRDPSGTKALAGNLRPERTAFYASLIVMGAFGAASTEHLSLFGSWVNDALFACLLLAYFSAFVFAIGVNDLADVRIDEVSGKTRPLPSGALTRAAMKDVCFFFFLWLMIGGLLCGYWAFFTIMVFTAAYYIYSAPPLRLKRIPFLSSFLIAVASLSALMAGFYFADAQKLVSDMPSRVIALILVCITLAVNFKDIKDIEGDRADDIWTLPVIFGDERGREIVGFLLAASFLAVPICLGTMWLFMPSLVAAILGYLIVTAKKYREWRVFVLYFLYAGAAGWILWLNPITL